MNIISNTCLGAYLMRDRFQQQFENPFCWNIIDYESMLNLVLNYKSLKDFKPEVFTEKNEYNELFACIKLNETIKIEYCHYLNNKFIRKNPNKNDVYCENPEELALTKYEERLKRINDNPIFVLQFQPKHKTTGNKNSFLKFINGVNNVCYPIVVISPFDIKNKNILNIKVTDQAILAQPKTASFYVKNIISKLKNDLNL